MEAELAEKGTNLQLWATEALDAGENLAEARSRCTALEAERSRAAEGAEAWRQAYEEEATRRQETARRQRMAERLAQGKSQAREYERARRFRAEEALAGSRADVDVDNLWAWIDGLLAWIDRLTTNLELGATIAENLRARVDELEAAAETGGEAGVGTADFVTEPRAAGDDETERAEPEETSLGEHRALGDSAAASGRAPGAGDDGDDDAGVPGGSEVKLVRAHEDVHGARATGADVAVAGVVAHQGTHHGVHAAQFRFLAGAQWRFDPARVQPCEVSITGAHSRLVEIGQDVQPKADAAHVQQAVGLGTAVPAKLDYIVQDVPRKADLADSDASASADAAARVGTHHEAGVARFSFVAARTAQLALVMPAGLSREGTSLRGDVPAAGLLVAEDLTVRIPSGHVEDCAHALARRGAGPSVKGTQVLGSAWVPTGTLTPISALAFRSAPGLCSAPVVESVPQPNFEGMALLFLGRLVPGVVAPRDMHGPRSARALPDVRALFCTRALSLDSTPVFMRAPMLVLDGPSTLMYCDKRDFSLARSSPPTTEFTGKRMFDCLPRAYLAETALEVLAWIAVERARLGPVQIMLVLDGMREHLGLPVSHGALAFLDMLGVPRRVLVLPVRSCLKEAFSDWVIHDNPPRAAGPGPVRQRVKARGAYGTRPSDGAGSYRRSGANCSYAGRGPDSCDDRGADRLAYRYADGYACGADGRADRGTVGSRDDVGSCDGIGRDSGAACGADSRADCGADGCANRGADCRADREPYEGTSGLIEWPADRLTGCGTDSGANGCSHAVCGAGGRADGYLDSHADDSLVSYADNGTDCCTVLGADRGADGGAYEATRKGVPGGGGSGGGRGRADRGTYGGTDGHPASGVNRCAGCGTDRRADCGTSRRADSILDGGADSGPYCSADFGAGRGADSGAAATAAPGGATVLAPGCPPVLARQGRPARASLRVSSGRGGRLGRALHAAGRALPSRGGLALAHGNEGCRPRGSQMDVGTCCEHMFKKIVYVRSDDGDGALAASSTQKAGDCVLSVHLVNGRLQVHDLVCLARAGPPGAHDGIPPGLRLRGELQRPPSRALEGSFVEMFDFCHALAYTSFDRDRQHSTYSMDLQAVAEWESHGLAAERLTLGMPLFGILRRGGAESVGYSDILAAEPSLKSSPSSDRSEDVAASGPDREASILRSVWAASLGEASLMELAWTFSERTGLNEDLFFKVGTCILGGYFMLKVMFASPVKDYGCDWPPPPKQQADSGSAPSSASART
ncbi:unnamed protein product [Prorocentrum cordatum]|uniref:DDE-1 domain-containing protein n=1 Tax=Prorocentrum cordatum TaxID=2364126 RepID=A0ABN9V4U9_9DINO|nr:unnamed protein product [Polarella glacialis]